MTADAVAPSPDSWIVAIHASLMDWKPLGAGVLIDPLRVLTCAHVVSFFSSAGDAWVAFPKAEHTMDRRMVKDVVIPCGVPGEIADAAVLVLDRPAPTGVEPAPLRRPAATSLVGDAWWAFGFPGGDALGSTASGQVGAALSFGWTRLHTSSRYLVDRGFSGGGLWSSKYQAVVGLVGHAKESGDNHGDARALTLRQIATWLPDMDLAGLTTWSAAAADEAALAAWGWRLDGDPEAGRHWQPRARGVTSESERGYRFRGRSVALTEIVAWLDRHEADRRSLLVTGSPGVGKSAVLGRIVTTADPGIRRALPEGDDAVKASLGSIACAVHAKGKTALEVAAEIARAASLPMPNLLDDLAPELRAALEDLVRNRTALESAQSSTSGVGAHGRFNVVIDALDEASTPADARAIVTNIVLPLVETCSSVGVQVIVGSRRRDSDGSLEAPFGGGVQMIDLDQPAYFAEEDLRAYALATLQLRGDVRHDSPYADDGVAAAVANRIAVLADKNFLVAGLIARAHGMHDDVPVEPGSLDFAGSVEGALQEYLRRLPSVAGVSAAAVLTVLAFAEAPGLPITLWQIGLEALGIDLSRNQLTTFARSAAANFLVETSTDGPSTSYRLFHQALNDALLVARADVSRRAADEQALADAWTNVGTRGGWDRVPAYLLRSLPVHSAAAGGIDRLLLDDAYLCHVDLRRLIPLADHATSPSGRQRARMLRLTPHALAAEPADRAAMFSLTSVLEDVRPGYPLTSDARYSTRWAQAVARTERLTLIGHRSGVNAVCALPASQGRYLLASASSDQTARVWDPGTGIAVQTLTGHQGGVNAVCALPTAEGRWLLVSAGIDGTVRLWDPDTGAALRTLTGHQGGVNAVCALPTADGRWLLVSAGIDETVRLWDPDTGAAVRTLTGHQRGVNAVCALPTREDRYLLASTSGDRTVRVWDPETGVAVQQLTGHQGEVYAVCALQVGPARYLLGSAGTDGTVRVWEPEIGTEVWALSGHRGAINMVCAVSADSDRDLLASAGVDGTVRVWDPESGAAVQTLTGHDGGVKAVCGLPAAGEGQFMLASASGDRTVRVWDLQPATAAPTLTAHRNEVNAVCALPMGEGGHLLASAVADGSVRVWDPETGTAAQTLLGHQGAVTAVCALPTRQGRSFVVSAGLDGLVRLWDPEAGIEVRTMAGRRGRVRALCAVPVGDGRWRLASADPDGSVRVWDPETGATVKTRNGPRNEVYAICAVPAGPREYLLASAGIDGAVRVWNPLTGAAVRTLSGHLGTVTALCAVPGGEGRCLVASAGLDGSVRVWDPVTGVVVQTLTGHDGAVNAVCCVPVGGDSRYMLASASDDRTVRVWDAAARTPLVIHTHHRATGCVFVAGLLIIGLDVGLLAVGLPSLGSIA